MFVWVHYQTESWQGVLENLYDCFHVYVYSAIADSLSYMWLLHSLDFCLKIYPCLYFLQQTPCHVWWLHSLDFSHRIFFHVYIFWNLLSSKNHPCLCFLYWSYTQLKSVNDCVFLYSSYLLEPCIGFISKLNYFVFNLYL